MRFLPIQYLEQLAGKAEPDKIRSVGSRNFTKIAVIKALSVANAWRRIDQRQVRERSKASESKHPAKSALSGPGGSKICW